MNKLIVGFNKSPILHDLPGKFLFIDDGPLIDALELPARRTITVLDLKKHSFNPFRGMDYRRACDFVDVLKAAFPEGENTLTKATFEYQILEALRGKPRKLATLIQDTKDTQYAYQKIQRLLMSDVLENVLTRPTNFSFKGTVIARLNRAELGDFDAFVLGNLLISQYPGTVVVPDFGFYACSFHVRLIRQNRLIAGITSFAEIPGKLRDNLLLIDTKVGSHTTPTDAETLALYAGIAPDTNAYTDFIASMIH